MKLSSLTKITKIGRNRLGQGHGSGRGKTSGRGTKGQNARSSRALTFEGGALPLIKRMPFLRGKGKNKSLRNPAVGINLNLLNVFKKGMIVDLKSLAENKLIDAEYAKKYGVKILGNGEIKASLIIKLPVSKQALKKIEKAGGKVEI